MKIHRNGFTMIELLVVIAIIVVLSGLLLPVIGKMQEKGRTVTCISNLKQLHQAAVNYAMEGGGDLPYTASRDVSEEDVATGQITHRYYPGWVNWWPGHNPAPSLANRKTYWWNKDGYKGVASVTNGSLFSSLGDSGDERVYVCPTMQRAARKRFGGSDDRSKVTRSYGMNASLNGASYQSMKGASRTIMFADQGFILKSGYRYALEKTEENTNGMNNNRWNDPAVTSNPGTQRICRHFDGCIDWKRGTDNTWEHIGEFHDGRGTAVFVDGHVELIKYAYTRYICSGAWDARKPVGNIAP